MRRHDMMHVRPRYSAGSPAWVSSDIAMSVADDERTFYEHALSGILGVELQDRAERLGLGRIVYTLGEHRGHFDVLIDEITGERIEGREAVELELAAIGTRPAPRKLEQVIESWGLDQRFREADLVERREILNDCRSHDPQRMQQRALGVHIIRHGREAL